MVSIKFTEDAKKMYDFLEKESSKSKKERIILESLKYKLKLIQNDPHYGNPIKKKLIPTYYKTKYSANNLFRVELPLFWRIYLDELRSRSYNVYPRCM